MDADQSGPAWPNAGIGNGRNGPGSMAAARARPARRGGARLQRAKEANEEWQSRLPPLVEVWFTDADGREIERVTVVANGMGEMHRVALQMEMLANAGRASRANVHFRAVGPDAKVEGIPASVMETI